MGVFDTHAHLTYFSESERAAVLDRAVAAGVRHIVNISTSKEAFDQREACLHPDINLLQSAATPPHDIQEDDPFFDTVAQSVHGLAAIGEVGIECFHKEAPPVSLQIASFLRYGELARSHNLPLIVHCRDGFEIILPLLKELGCRGVVHCFTGTIEHARQLLDLGWIISWSGIITYPKSMLRSIVAYVPLSSSVLETDSPFLPPQPFRGQKNEPAWVRHMAVEVAAIKSMPVELVIRDTTATACRLFNIPLIDQ